MVIFALVVLSLFMYGTTPATPADDEPGPAASAPA